MKIFGREIKFPKIFADRPSVNRGELGRSGTSIFSGRITDNEEYVSDLKGSQAIDTYEKMRRSDGVVKSALLACELPIRSAEWSVEPATEDEMDQEVADFVEHSLMEGMSVTWDDFLRQALTMLVFGFSVFEKVFEMEEWRGKEMVGWKKFAQRLPDTVDKWETEGGEDGIVQQFPDGGRVSIPIEKLLIFTYRKEGDNWEGVSLLRSAYRPWYVKYQLEKINNIAFERQGLGVPTGELPEGYTPTERDELEDVLANMRANEKGYVIRPQGWDIEYMDMKANTIKEPTETIRRLDREILSSVLAQFLNLGADKHGSRAVSRSQSDIFHNNLRAIAKGVTHIINKYAIPQLVDFNYTVEEYPELKFSNIGSVDKSEVADAISALMKSGAIMPDDRMEDHLRKLFKLPEMPEEEEVQKGEKTEEKSVKKKGSEIDSIFEAWRPLTFAEQKVKFNDINAKMNSEEKRLKMRLEGILKKMEGSLLEQVQRVLEEPDSDEKRRLVKEMRVEHTGDYRKEVLKSSKKIFEYGKVMAAHEMKKQPPATPDDEELSIKDKVELDTDMMVNDLMKAVKGSLLNVLRVMAEEEGVSPLKKVKTALTGATGVVINNVPSLVVSQNFNQGRRLTFDRYEESIYALQRSEILDQVTCSYCLSVDGRVFEKDDPFAKNDIFHTNCRGIWVEILKDERRKPEIKGIPQSLRDRFESVNRFAPPRNPLPKPDSIAEDFYGKERVVEDVKQRMDEIYEVAPSMKKEIDDIADEIASDLTGARVAKAPLKEKETALKKILERKGGDVEALGDVARNTIVVKDRADLRRASRMLEARGNVVKLNVYDGKGPLGYRGRNYKVITNEGIEAEMQINTPEMIWAKEQEGSARAVLGDDVWERVNSRVDHTRGVKPGNGHTFYERWREVDKLKDKSEVAERSKVYYQKVTKKYYGD